MSGARLSIIMPVLNEAANIEAALIALAPYRQRGVELIVVDGASRDGTPARARPLADHVCIRALERHRPRIRGDDPDDLRVARIYLPLTASSTAFRASAGSSTTKSPTPLRISRTSQSAEP